MSHISESPVLQISRFYTGLYTFRNPLVVPIRQFGRKLVELYDALIDGSNMEITNTLTLKRRAGYTSYSSIAISGTPFTFYSFKPSSFPGTVDPIIDTTTGVYYQPPGVTAPTTLIAKGVASQTNFCGIGPYLYMGNPNFSQKWDGPSGSQGVTNWGISIGAIAGSLGPNKPTAAANVPVTGQAWSNPTNIEQPDSVYSSITVALASSTSSGPNFAAAASTSGFPLWANPLNARFDDGAFASIDCPALTVGGSLQLTNYGFNVPSTATITGVLVEAKMNQGTPGTGTVTGLLRLVKGGSASGSTHNVGALPTTLGYVASGSSADLWGNTFTYNDINASGFGVHLVVEETGGLNDRTAYVDAIRITVYYTIPATGGSSDYLQGTGYGFSLPVTSKVTGIGVQVLGFMPPGQSSSYVNVNLLVNGAVVGTPKQVFLPSANSPINIGGAGDLWGLTSLTPSQVDASNFGVSIQGIAVGVNSTFNIDCVQVTVFELGGPTVTVTGVGTFSAQSGYQYVYCYGNSVSGHVSSPTPVSISTGPFSNMAQANITLVASTDPQVNQIRVFRTTDGGGQPFFEIPTSPYPNTSQTVTDNAPDNILQIANICPLPSFNDPPPAGLVDPVWYAGRLWGHVGNRLYFASGPDITMGNPQEAWFPVYQFALPTSIIRKFPLPNGMIIETTDDMFIVRGIDTASFTVNEFMRDIGMRNWNAADSDGSNIYIYTTDRQMLLLNANGVQSISSAVSDVIANVDPSAAYVSIFRYTARNSLLFLGDGTTNIYPYNINQQAWCPVQVPTGGAQAIATIETQPGQWSFLRGKSTANQTIAQRSLTTFSDEGTTYTCSAVFGPVPVADFLQLAQVRDVVLAMANTGQLPTLSVLPNEVYTGSTATFSNLGQPTSTEPPELSATPSVSFTCQRYTWKTGPLPEVMNFYHLSMAWGATATADEMYAWTAGGTQTTGGSALGAPGQLPEIQGR